LRIIKIKTTASFVIPKNNVNDFFDADLFQPGIIQLVMQGYGMRLNLITPGKGAQTGEKKATT